MTNIRRKIDDAIELYDTGNWQLSVEKLESLKGKGMQKHEIEVLISWNWWKMGKKQDAVAVWKKVISVNTDVYSVTLSSAHAGLSIYYAEEGNKKEALKNAQLAQKLLSEYATMHQNKTLNSCLIALAKIGELEKAEEIMRKVAGINERLINSIDPKIAREATHQRAKNGYNLVSLVYIPQERWEEAFSELECEVIPRYQVVGAETDEAAAWHRISEIAERTGDLYIAYAHEKKSLKLWKKHEEDAPGRVETSLENIKRIENKMREGK